MDVKKILSLLKFKTNYNKTYFIVNKDIIIEEQDIKIYKGAVIVNAGIFDDVNETAFSVIYHVKPIGSANTENIKEGIVVVSFKELLALILAQKLIPFLVDTNHKDIEILKQLNM